jgi:hypothetical protein
MSLPIPNLSFASSPVATGAPVQGAPALADNGPWVVNFGSGTASQQGATDASQAAPGQAAAAASSFTAQDWVLVAFAFVAFVIGMKVLHGNKAG